MMINQNFVQEKLRADEVQEMLVTMQFGIFCFSLLRDKNIIIIVPVSVLPVKTCYIYYKTGLFHGLEVFLNFVFLGNMSMSFF
jgi:hypothetical protein